MTVTLLHRAWQAAPAQVRSPLRQTADAASQRAMGLLARRPRRLRPGPLILSAFAGATSGIGRGALGTTRGLRAAGLEPEIHDIGAVLSGARLGEARLWPDALGGVWIVHANAPEAYAVMARTRPRDWQGRYRIGVWAWELPEAPRAWLRLARLFDEVWVPSRFVADSLRGSPVPVRRLPHYVPLPATPPREPPRFRVLAVGDVKSSLTRKGLFDAVGAYVAAFPEPVPDVDLVVKVASAGDDPAAMRALGAHGRPDVVVLTDVLSDGAMDALQDEVAVFLSMHRAEGYGLTIAEHLARGRPVVATGWSGNMDFMGGFDAMEVAHALVPVRDPGGPYEAYGRQRWAEPSVDDAAAKLSAFHERWRQGRLCDPAYRAPIAAGNASWAASADVAALRRLVLAPEARAPLAVPEA